MDKSYEDAWAETGPGEAPAKETADGLAPAVEPVAPAVNAVKAAYQAKRADEAKQFSDAFNKDDTAAEPDPVIPAEPADFKVAAAAARKAGLAAFEWNGKKYATDLAKTPAKDEPADDASRLKILSTMRADKGNKA